MERMAESEYAPCRNVKKSVEECEQPQCAAESDHIGQIEQSAHRGNCQREDQEAKRPIASLTHDQPAGDGIKIAIACRPHNCHSRNKGQSNENELCPPAPRADICDVVHSLTPRKSSSGSGTLLVKRPRHLRPHATSRRRVSQQPRAETSRPPRTPASNAVSCKPTVASGRVEFDIGAIMM